MPTGSQMTREVAAGALAALLGGTCRTYQPSLRCAAAQARQWGLSGQSCGPHHAVATRSQTGPPFSHRGPVAVVGSVLHHQHHQHYLKVLVHATGHLPWLVPRCKSPSEQVVPLRVGDRQPADYKKRSCHWALVLIVGRCVVMPAVAVAEMVAVVCGLSCEKNVSRGRPVA